MPCFNFGSKRKDLVVRNRELGNTDLIVSFKKILFIYWSIVDLQHCVSFRCPAKWFSYIYIPWLCPGLHLKFSEYLQPRPLLKLQTCLSRCLCDTHTHFWTSQNHHIQNSTSDLPPTHSRLPPPNFFISILPEVQGEKIKEEKEKEANRKQS